MPARASVPSSKSATRSSRAAETPRGDHGPSASPAHSDHARSQALLGRRPRGQADGPQVQGLRQSLSLSRACSARSAPRATSTWIQASGRGKLFSFEIAHQIFNKAFKVKTPVVLAMVELEEGPRMLTNLINCEADPKKLRCDMPVEVVFEKQTDEISSPDVPAGEGPMNERAQQQGLHRRRGRERRDRHAARQEHAQPAPGGHAQRHPRRRPEGLRHRRRVHRRPALAGHHRRGARRGPALRRRHHRRRLLLHHHGRPRHAGPAPRPVRRRGGLARRVRPLRRGRDPAARYRHPRPVRGPVRLRRGADLLRPDHHPPHARVRHHPRAVGAGGGLHAQVGGVEPQGQESRADHRRRTCSTRGRSSGRSTC